MVVDRNMLDERHTTQRNDVTMAYADPETRREKDREYSRLYRERNKEKIRERQRAYYAVHKEKILESNRKSAKKSYKARYAKNRDKILSDKKEYYKAHKDEIAAKRKERYLKHKERLLRINAEYRAKVAPDTDIRIKIQQEEAARKARIAAIRAQYANRLNQHQRQL